MKDIIKSFLVLIFLLVAFEPSSASSQFFFQENKNVAKPAPDFTLPDLEGKKIAFSEFKSGGNAILFFWATWCPLCHRELGELNKKQQQLAQEGIKVALIDIGEEKAFVQEYLQKNKVDMPVLLDEDSLVAQAYNLIGVPTFVFIDKKGVVRDVQHSLPENYKKIFAEPVKE